MVPTNNPRARGLVVFDQRGPSARSPPSHPPKRKWPPPLEYDLRSIPTCCTPNRPHRHPRCVPLSLCLFGHPSIVQGTAGGPQPDESLYILARTRRCMLVHTQSFRSSHGSLRGEWRRIRLRRWPTFFFLSLFFSFSYFFPLLRFFLYLSSLPSLCPKIAYHLASFGTSLFLVHALEFIVYPPLPRRIVHFSRDNGGHNIK